MVAGEQQETGESGEFETGLEVARRRGLTPYSHRETPVEAFVIGPVMKEQAAFELWDSFIKFKRAILSDPNCFDTIDGGPEMNRTGATRLATAFGLSLETLRVDEVDMGSGDRRFVVRVRASRGARYADGVGSCRMSEITSRDGKLLEPASKREHFALTRADTRARKRAIADILGGTEAE